ETGTVVQTCYSSNTENLIVWELARESSFFFFQAEDGIRDLIVTGVQTCALPICGRDAILHGQWTVADNARHPGSPEPSSGGNDRSEERRVGKECRSRWSP